MRAPAGCVGIRLSANLMGYMGSADQSDDDDDDAG